MNTCWYDFDHEYAERLCVCGAVFCYGCCRSTNVDQGGRHEENYMLCPKCGRDYYEEIEQ